VCRYSRSCWRKVGDESDGINALSSASVNGGMRFTGSPSFSAMADASIAAVNAVVVVETVNMLI
jgi:hypothetical protein